ncbi:hypothetical protein [Bdellovibrio sp. NC01]|uniref:hypothetical protein n=1 Tax=Bdellovibrio sp. NC01 TaxID=2220073 RepID=UPI00115B00BE|nr:hypothetical protein [Bdellovibrio sp. NC01]QDK37827.1 hypothetical protein DOE51_09630 [Bdellovibrio sp. NC01]
MRSRTFVKRTMPCLAVILAVSMTAPVAHAGILDTAKAVASAMFKKPATAQQTQEASTTVEMKSTAAVEVSADAAAVETVQAPSRSELTKKALENLKNQINNSYKNVSSGASDLSRLRGAAQMNLEIVSSLPGGQDSMIVPSYTENNVIFTLRVTEKGLAHPELLIRNVSTLAMLTHMVGVGYPSSQAEMAAHSAFIRTLESPHSWVETYMNAAEGSIVSKARLKNIELKILSSNGVAGAVAQMLSGGSTIDNAAAQVQEEIAKLTQETAELNEKAAKYERQQEKALDKWRSETGALEKYEAAALKLDDLLLRNDRKGVRDMLEAYLPWQIMEPMEYKAWKNWLEAIEHPDLTKQTVAFRGLDYKTDKIQREMTAKGEKFAFMSTVLTKNQGSYTRRLRSLSTNRLKNGDDGQAGFGEKVVNVKITDQFTAHARDPKASSFLSFTFDPSVANRFLGGEVMKKVKGVDTKVPGGGMLVVKMDSRRLIPNVSSMYANEIELLAPLVVFPDEVVAYHEGSFREMVDGKDGSTRFKEFIADISTKTGVDFTKWNSWNPDGSSQIIIGQQKEAFKKDGLLFMKDLSEQAVNAPFCSKIF